MNTDLEIRGLVAKGAEGAVLLAYDLRRRRFSALKIFRAASEARLARALAAARAVRPGDGEGWCLEAEDCGSLADASPVLAAEMKKLPGLHGWLRLRYVHGPNLLELASSDASWGYAETSAACAVVAQRLASRPEGRGHYDLKPENVLVDREGRLFLTDALLEGASGTPFYAAPEQREPGQTPDARADLFALGRLIQRLAARTFPKDGDPPDKLPPFPEIPEELSHEHRQAIRKLTVLSQKLCSLSPEERGTIDEAARTLLECSALLGDLDPTRVVRASLSRIPALPRLVRLSLELEREPLSRRDEGSPKKHDKRTLGLQLLSLCAAGLLVGWSVLSKKAPSLPQSSGGPHDGTTAASGEPASPSEVFDPHTHRDATLTLLGPNDRVDPKHAFYKIVPRDIVHAVSLEKSDGTLLWRQDTPLEVYRFDLAPGSYLFGQLVNDQVDPRGKPVWARAPFELGAGDSLVAWTDGRVERAPSN